MQKTIKCIFHNSKIINQCCRTADGKKELKCLFVLVLICISLLDLLEKTIKEYIGWLGSLIIELNFLWVEIKRISLMSQKWVLLTRLFPYFIPSINYSEPFVVQKVEWKMKYKRKCWKERKECSKEILFNFQMKFFDLQDKVVLEKPKNRYTNKLFYINWL